MGLIYKKHTKKIRVVKLKKKKIQISAGKGGNKWEKVEISDCVRKSHIYTYIFLNFSPLPHLKNPYYENVKFFQNIKFSSNHPQKSVNLSPSNGLLVFVPD